MTGAAIAAGLLAGSAVLLLAGGPARWPGQRLGPRLGRATGGRRPPGLSLRSEPAPGGLPAERHADLPVDLVLELVAGLLDAGAPVRQAVGLVDRAVGRHPAADLAAGPAEQAGAGATEGLAEVIALSESSGLPPAALLRARADDLRRDRAAAHGRAVRRLGVQLVLPMGLCLLPAFVLLGVVPVVADLLGLV